MKYTVSENNLKLREFGRNVQMMVEYAKSLNDTEERNALCREIVRIMSNISPNVKDSPDFRQKLWDHLYHLAEYDIDIDGEYPMPDPEEKAAGPKEPMDYPWQKSRYRIYGRNVELMVDKAVEMGPGEARDDLVNLIANIMKMHLKNNNERDGSAELVVVEHLRKMSNNELNYQVEELTFYKAQAAPAHTSGSMKYTQRNKGYQKQGRRKKKHRN